MGPTHGMDEVFEVGGEAVTVGVLTCFYHAVVPAELRQSMASILDQHRRPDEWVVVVDGPVPAVLDEVVLRVQEQCLAVEPPVHLTIMRLPENVGNGRARNRGLEALTTDYVFIQDADDVSEPTRIAETLDFMQRHSFDFAGTSLAEFRTGTESSTTVRRYPDTHADVERLVRLNNPIGHPSLAFRRECGLLAGGYQHLPGNEDYDFVARMVAHGCRGASLEEPLVRYRVDPDLFRRRGGAEVVRAELDLSRRLRRYGLVGPVERWPILVTRLAYRLAPPRIKHLAYSHGVVPGSGSGA